MTVTSQSEEEPISHRKSALIESHDSSSPDRRAHARSIDINLLWILLVVDIALVCCTGTRRCSGRQEAQSFRAACGDAAEEETP